MLRYLIIFSLISGLSKNAYSEEFKSFTASGLVDGTLSKASLELKIIRQFKERLLAEGSEFLIREKVLSNRYISDYVTKRFAMNSIQLKEVSSTFSYFGGDIFLEVEGYYKLNPISYDNYIDAYFENKILASRSKNFVFKISINIIIITYRV